MAVTTKVVTAVVSAATKTYSYSSIDLLPTDLATLNDQLKIYLTPLSTGITNQLTLTTDFTFDTLPTKEITLVGTTATNLAVGDLISVVRETKNDELYTEFTGLSNLRSDAVNNNSNQLLHIIQENITGVSDALQKNNALTAWDSEGLPSQNCAAAVSSSGWTTLAQVNALLAGAEIADMQDGYTQLHDGNNSTTVFACPTFPKTDVSADKINIYIDGIHQRPTTDYTYALSASSVPTVTFTTAPPTGTDNIEIRTIKGSVQAVLSDDSIDGDALVDNSVPTSKLEFSSGAANRIILVDAAGLITTPALASSQISDLSSTITGIRLDQMTTPTNSVAFGSQTLTGVGTGTANDHGVNKGQMDSAISAAVAVAGSNSFTDEWTSSTGTTRSITSLSAGTYTVTIAISNALSGTITVNGTTYSAVDSAANGVESFTVTTLVTDTITIACSGCAVRRASGFRITS